MPYNSNNGGGGGPWGGGGGGNRGGGKGPWGGGGGGGGGGNQQGPDLDDLIRKGRDQLRVVLGGKGGGGRPNGTGGGGGGGGLEKLLPIIIPAVLIIGWVYQSLYRVDTSEQSVEMFFGKYYNTGTEGLNFAPWPVVTYEKYPVTVINTERIGVGASGAGLMLTGDENFVDIEFSVGWNVKRLDQFLFNLDRHSDTVQAVSESVMREVIARSNFADIVNVQRSAIEGDVKTLIQETLDAYGSGIHVEVVNFEKA
ncbi:MAG: protease modulator HflK, partial [Pseudomonadota bacterium]